MKNDNKSMEQTQQIINNLNHNLYMLYLKSYEEYLKRYRVYLNNPDKTKKCPEDPDVYFYKLKDNKISLFKRNISIDLVNIYNIEDTKNLNSIVRKLYNKIDNDLSLILSLDSYLGPALPKNT